MKFTHAQLERIIQEEVQRGIDEGWLDRQRAKFSASNIKKGIASRFGKPGTKIQSMGASDQQKAAKIVLLHMKKNIKLFQALIAAGDDFAGDIAALGVGDVGTIPALLDALGQNKGTWEGEIQNWSKLKGAAQALEQGATPKAEPAGDPEAAPGAEPEAAPGAEPEAAPGAEPEADDVDWDPGIPQATKDRAFGRRLPSAQTRQGRAAQAQLRERKKRNK